MSSNAVRFCVPGIQGKARPRMVVSGSGAHVFTPRKTKEYERRVATCYRLAGGTMHLKPVALKIAIGVFAPLPKSAPKRVAADQFLAKPDIDNIAKAVMDGLNGVAYEDDVQVVQLLATKYPRTRAIHESVVEVVVEEEALDEQGR